MKRKPKSKLFISYSSEDYTLAEQVVATCKKLGIDCFLDRKDINWGDTISAAVGRGIVSCTHVLVILSPASLKSGWVPFEVGYATGGGKTVLPLLTHPSLDLPGYLAGLLYKTTIDNLEESLRRATTMAWLN